MKKFSVNMEKNNKIDLRKIQSYINSKSFDIAKDNKCYLCQKSITSYCNSHTIPDFILSNNSEKGYVYNCCSFKEQKITLEEEKVGKARAGLFFLICNECDQLFFKDYESSQKLNSLFQNLSTHSVKIDDVIMLAKIYVKSLFYKIYRNRISLAEKENFCIEGNFANKGTIKFVSKTDPYKLTLNDLETDYLEVKQIIDNPKFNSFELIYVDTLNYQIPIMAQTLISINKDLNDVTINDVYNYDPNYHMKEICIAIYPYAGKTQILIFCLKSAKERYKNFVSQFKRLKKDKKLKVIQAVLFSHSDLVFVSPKILETMKKDKVFKQIGGQLPRDKTMEEILKFNPLISISNYDMSENYFKKKFEII